MLIAPKPDIFGKQNTNRAEHQAVTRRLNGCYDSKQNGVDTLCVSLFSELIGIAVEHIKSDEKAADEPNDNEKQQSLPI